MKVTQEKLPASQVGLDIEIPSDVTQKTYERVLQKFTQSANIPGFRKGKVPRHILIQRLGSEQVKMAALEELVQDGVSKAIEEANVAAIGSPELKTPFEELAKTYTPGSPLTFSATIDVKPEIQLKQYQGFTVQAEDVPYNPSKVEQVLDEYRGRVATLVPVEGRAAILGDITIVDYEGRLTDVDPTLDEDAGKFPGNEAHDFQVELAPGRFIDGFIDGIVGMKVGETKDISVQFPPEYSMADIAGKPVVFTITLKELKEKELPELDDDFAQEVSEFETFAELRESLEKRYQKEADDETQQNKHSALLEALLEQVEVELPETMVRNEVDYMLTQTAMRLQNQGMDIKQLFTQDTVPRLREQARPEAILSLQRSLALKEIAKRESITVDASALRAKVQDIKAQMKGEDLDESRLRDVLEDEMLTENVMTWLEAHSTVELVPLGTKADTDIPFTPDLTGTIDVTASTETISDVDVTNQLSGDRLEPTDSGEAQDDDDQAAKPASTRKKTSGSPAKDSSSQK
jgi:trigger factor